MTVTEELRRLLDERGVDYRVSATGYSIDIGPYTTAYANRSDTTLDVSLRQVTPEQAIAATLGAGTCHSTTPIDAWCFACSECGKSFPRHELHLANNHGEINFCPNCGRKVVDE